MLIACGHFNADGGYYIIKVFITLIEVEIT